ncbi:MAG: PAS domain-containing protein [Candidatus Thermoplasmatota archaeon]|jgi:PAS domain S-box-containing protein
MNPGDAALLALAGSPEVRAHLAYPNTGVYIVRPDGHIIWASPSMEAVTGYRPQDLVGRNGWDIFVAPEDLPKVAEFRAMLAEGDGTLWTRLLTPGGAREWFRIDTSIRGGGIVCAFHRENEPAMRHTHYFIRSRSNRA